MKIENATIQSYAKYLKDKSRPPSKGGNTRAWHQHVLTIDGEKYSFLALGAQQWVFKSDTVTFDWDWDDSRRFRNIKCETIETRDKNGNLVARGNPGRKPWRTAETRMPVSRGEWSD